MWSRNHSECVVCKTTAHKHIGRGMCYPCYYAWWLAQPGNLEKTKGYKTEWYETKVKPTNLGKLAREEANFHGHRQEVLTRDGHRCVQCGSKETLVVHHKDNSGRLSETRDHSVEMLITLCRACHARHRAPKSHWSRNHTECIKCGRLDVKHRAFGLCVNCYSLKRYYEQRAKL